MNLYVSSVVYYTFQILYLLRCCRNPFLFVTLFLFHFCVHVTAFVFVLPYVIRCPVGIAFVCTVTFSVVLLWWSLLCCGVACYVLLLFVIFGAVSCYSVVLSIVFFQIIYCYFVLLCCGISCDYFLFF